MYKIYKVIFEANNMNVDLPEGYMIDGVLSSSNDHAVLVLKKLPQPEQAPTVGQGYTIPNPGYEITGTYFTDGTIATPRRGY